MTYILERIRDDSEKYAKASKNLKELKMKFPCIKTIEKQMKEEFDAQKRKNQERYEEYASKKSEPEQQFCKFQKRVDEMVKNSRVFTAPITFRTGDTIQGQLRLIRQPVTA